jgi:hypothetical protein
MFKVKPLDQPRARPADIIRELVYSSLPIFCAGTIWAVGYATSMDSKVTSEMRSHETGRASLKQALENQVPANDDSDTGRQITSIADPD